MKKIMNDKQSKRLFHVADDFHHWIVASSKAGAAEIVAVHGGFQTVAEWMEYFHLNGEDIRELPLDRLVCLQDPDDNIWKLKTTIEWCAKLKLGYLQSMHP